MLKHFKTQSREGIFLFSAPGMNSSTHFIILEYNCKLAFDVRNKVNNWMAASISIDKGILCAFCWSSWSSKLNKVVCSSLESSLTSTSAISFTSFSKNNTSALVVAEFVLQSEIECSSSCSFFLSFYISFRFIVRVVQTKRFIQSVVIAFLKSA